MSRQLASSELPFKQLALNLRLPEAESQILTVCPAVLQSSAESISYMQEAKKTGNHARIGPSASLYPNNAVLPRVFA